jgi:hypothetical protein
LKRTEISKVQQADCRQAILASCGRNARPSKASISISRESRQRRKCSTNPEEDRLDARIKFIEVYRNLRQLPVYLELPVTRKVATSRLGKSPPILDGYETVFQRFYYALRFSDIFAHLCLQCALPTPTPHGMLSNDVSTSTGKHSSVFTEALAVNLGNSPHCRCHRMMLKPKTSQPLVHFSRLAEVLF